MSSLPYSLPPDVKQVRRKIEHWRRTRSKRSPMPPRLWRFATELAVQHGVYPISRALGLGYDGLKVRVEAANRSRPGEDAAAGAFVELTPSQLVGSVCVPGLVSQGTGVTVEFCDSHGRSMVARLAGTSTCDLVGLARSFWDAGS